MLTLDKAEGTVVFVLWGAKGPLGCISRLPDNSEWVQFTHDNGENWDDATEAEREKVMTAFQAVHQLKRSQRVAVLVGRDSSDRPVWAEGFFEALLSMRKGPLYSVKIVAWPGVAYTPGLAEHVVPLEWAKAHELNVVDFLPNDVVMLDPVEDEEAVSTLFHFCLLLLQQTEDNDIRFTLASFSDRVIEAASALLSRYGRTIVKTGVCDELAIQY